MVIEKFRQSAARGAKMVPFAGQGGGGMGGGSLANFFGWNNNLPGAEYDYRKNAGKLWENSVVLAVIKFLCRRWPEARMVVYSPSQAVDGKDKMLTTHPLLSLVENPSTDYDRSVHEAGMLLSYVANGNAYAFKLRSASGKVVGLQYIPHFRIAPYWPKDGSEFISGYVYNVNGQKYLLDKNDVVHLRDGVDPENERVGLSSLGAVLREICTDNEAATFSAAILRNMGVPGVVVSPKQVQGAGVAMTPDRQQEFKRAWVEFTRDNRGEPMIQGIPVDVTNPGFSPEQMVLDKTRAIPVSRICAAVGFDPMVLGYPSETKTYANYKEALEAAYEGCLIPMQRTFDMQTTRALSDDVLNAKPGDYLGRDYSNVRVLQEDMDKLFERVANVYQKGLIMRSVGLRMIGEVFTPADDVYYTDIAPETNATPGDEPALDSKMVASVIARLHARKDRLAVKRKPALPPPSPEG